MSQHIDYYMTVPSPWSYLGAARFAKLVKAAGASVTVHPVNYGIIFPETGGLPLPKRHPVRQAYRLQELARWKKRLGIPITIQPKFFPVNATLAEHAILALREQGGDALSAAEALGKAVWEEELNVADETVLVTVLTRAGFDGRSLISEAKDNPDLASLQTKESEEAMEKGVFGAPSYVIDGQVIWGQDRLDFVAEALGLPLDMAR